jgi:hypothetical protein
MQVWKTARLGVIPVLLIGAGIAIASSGGPPRSRTGAPAIAAIAAEGTCVGCHNNFSLNNGVTVSLVNPPSYYTAGGTYTFSVQVASTMTAGNPNRVWSFELTAVNMTDGTGVGTFTNVSGQGTQIITGTGSYSTRQYIESTDRPGASRRGRCSGRPRTGWVPWFRGCRRRRQRQPSGDRVGTGSLVLQDVTAVEAATWGRVKALYR